MINEDKDVDPDNPDSLPPMFLESDRRKFDHRNPRDVLAHDAALANFEARMIAIRRANANDYSMKWNHVDGPMMTTAWGMPYWLTLRERFLAFIGRLDLDKLHNELRNAPTSRLLRRFW